MVTLLIFLGGLYFVTQYPDKVMELYIRIKRAVEAALQPVTAG